LAEYESYRWFRRLHGACLVIPIYGSFIYDRIKEKAWRRVFKHSLIAVLCVLILFILGWYGLSSQTASAKTLPNLEYLDRQSFDEEAKLWIQKNTSSNPDQALQIVRIKFDEAGYAQKRNDFDRAVGLYKEIERGSDENGTFTTFPSACIKNNMAISYFRRQGDKQFKPYTLLLDALRLEPKPQHELDVVQRNIDALDHFVNE